METKTIGAMIFRYAVFSLFLATVLCICEGIIKKHFSNTALAKLTYQHLVL